MNGPINEPNAPPIFTNTLNKPAFPSGISSIEIESVQTINSACVKPNNIMMSEARAKPYNGI